MKIIKQTKLFTKCLTAIKDKITVRLIASKIDNLQAENFSNTKSVGDKVFELKINTGKGYRLYFANIDNEIILLLIGGDKSTQNKDIKKAKDILKNYKEV